MSSEIDDAIWAYPTEAQFAAFRDLPQDQPFQMLNLIRLRAEAAYPADHLNHGKSMSGADAYRAYGENAAPYFTGVGGRQVWVGEPELTMIGPMEERWDVAFIAEYPNASTFFAMLGNPGYAEVVKHRQAAVAESRLFRFAPREPSDRFDE